MVKGVLVVITSNDCPICNQLNSMGFFDSLAKNLNVDSIQSLELETMDKILEVAPVFSMDKSFPSFKFMSQETFQEALKGGKNWQELAKKVTYFNRELVDNGKLKAISKYTALTLRTIQQFCDDSYEILFGEGHKVLPRFTPGYYDKF